ncbi:sugar nucleotide-binding protein [Bacteroidota bacterium]
MKVLITEAYNLAADSLLRLLKSETNFDIYLLSHKVKEIYHKGRINLYPVNIMDFKSIKKIIYGIKPDVIINTLDYGNIHSSDKKKIWNYNVIAAENYFSICRVLDCHLISISNEFVFDGVKGPYIEQDKPGAVYYYGTSKHAMENACLTNVNKCTLVRASMLYGYNSYGYTCFSSELIATLQSKNNLEIKEDYLTNPCFADEFAYAIIKIIEKKRLGIYHVAGSEYLRLSDFAVKIALSFKLDDGFIKTKKPENYKKFGLVNYKAETDLGIKFSNIENSLMAMQHYIYGDKILPL